MDARGKRETPDFASQIPLKTENASRTGMELTITVYKKSGDSAKPAPNILVKTPDGLA
jgi:hypothetical protein